MRFGKEVSVFLFGKQPAYCKQGLRVALVLTGKYTTRQKRIAKEKNSSLTVTKKNSFINIGP